MEMWGGRQYKYKIKVLYLRRFFGQIEWSRGVVMRPLLSTKPRWSGLIGGGSGDSWYSTGICSWISFTLARGERKIKEKMNSKSKGSGFERDCSRMLSLWATNGRRDDAIWRSASSGALTTVGKGRSLAHTGDFAATDGEVAWLFEHVVIEAKRGYNRCSLQDLLDVPTASLPKNPVWKMVTKLGESCTAQGKDGLLLWKRDRRELLVFYRPLPSSQGWSDIIPESWLSFRAPDGSVYFGLPWTQFRIIVSVDHLKFLLVKPAVSSSSTPSNLS